MDGICTNMAGESRPAEKASKLQKLNGVTQVLHRRVAARWPAL